MVTILIMSAKIATVGLLKTKVFWTKGYDIIITVHDVISKILSCDWNSIVDGVMRPRFGNSSISMREVFITLTLWGIWPEKPILLRGPLGSISII